MRVCAWALGALLGCARTTPIRPAPSVAAPPLAVDTLGAAPAGPLGDEAVPLRYGLTLEVVPTRERFAGEVAIAVQLRAPATGVWLHGRDFDVSEAEVRDASGGRAARWVPAARPGINALRWEGLVGPGEVTLRVRFSAPFGHHLEGLYQVETESRRYAFTQFEAISARRAFPCFDDPRFKTPFDITLVTASEDEAVTNTEVIAQEPRAGGLRAHRFATTLPLPTYLLAFAVGPLDVVTHAPIAPNAWRTRPIPLRGVAARGRGPLLQRSLDDAGPLVTAFERYFAQAYPYPKLDLIAVPDFAAGAMENAGAITFREPLLLLRPNAPPDQVRAMDSVLAHELAHHWFGDLVTLRWWDDIWLNESFATWAAAWATDEVFPEHRSGLSLLMGVHAAMNTDALSATVPVRRAIASDADLRGGSSSIVYQKGAAVLGMLERWIGHDAFRDALRAYLPAHAHGSATAEELLAALRSVAGERPVDAVTRDFIAQPGVPVLAMELVCAGDRARVRVSQRRFALPAGSDTRDGAWRVPVCVRHPGEGGAITQTCGLVDAANDTLALPGACPAWVMPNADGAGYYRWSLVRAAWDALIAQGWSRLSTRERLNVVTNAQALFAAGVLTLPALRPMLRAAASDPERAVSTAPFALWQRIFEEHLGGPRAAARRREVAAMYLPAWRAVGWSPRAGEPAERALLRRDLAAFLGLVARDPTVLAEGAGRGAAQRAGGSALPTELLGPCLAMHLRGASAAAVTAVAQRATTSLDAVERGILLNALGEAPPELLGSQVLPLALRPDVRTNEVFTTLRAAMRRPEARDVAFAWLRGNADALFARVSEGARAGAPWLASSFCDAGSRAQVEAFFGPLTAALPGSEGQLRGALEAITVCAAEVEAQRSTVDR